MVNTTVGSLALVVLAMACPSAAAAPFPPPAAPSSAPGMVVMSYYPLGLAGKTFRGTCGGDVQSFSTSGNVVTEFHTADQSNEQFQLSGSQLLWLGGATKYGPVAFDTPLVFLDDAVLSNGGTLWQRTTASFRGKKVVFELRVIVQFIAGSVAVPAGTFSNCRKVDLELTADAFETAPPFNVISTFRCDLMTLAPNVGRIQTWLFDANWRTTCGLDLLSVPPPVALKILTTSLAAGKVGNTYSQTLQASGGTVPYTWSITSGSLPPGLALNSSSGAIGGTPSAPGSYSFRAGLTDMSSPTLSASGAFTLVVAPADLVITTTSPLPPGKTGQAYSQTLQATGGATPYTWSIVSGSLPTGLRTCEIIHFSFDID